MSDINNPTGGGSNVSSPTAVAAAGGGIPYKPQIVTTRTGIPNSTIVGNNSNASLRIDSRLQLTVGPQAVSQLQVGMSGFILIGSNDQLLTTDINYEAAVETTSPSAYVSCTFPGNTSPTLGNTVADISPGSALVLSDPVVGFDFTAGSTFFLRQGISIPQSAGQIPQYSVNDNTGLIPGVDSAALSPSTISQTPGTGAITTPTSGISFGGFYPSVVLGVPAAPHPSVIYIGDSIAASAFDNLDSLGSAGFLQRGLESVGANSYPIPYHAQASNGATTQQFSSFIFTQRQRAYWKYATHFIIQTGTNDIQANSATLTQLQGYLATLCASIKRVIGPYGKPPKIYVCTLAVRTNSGNTAPITGFTVGGTRDLYNAWLLAGGITNIDGVIDSGSVTQTTGNLWVSGFNSGDGTHPTQAGHIAMAVPVNTAALTFNP